MAKSAKNISVEYNPTGGPITLEVLAGFATMGEFILAYRTKGSFEFLEWGKDPKRVDDELNDIFVVPFDLAILDTHIILILGKYGPAPDHTQVKLEYIFFQDGEELQKTVIQEALEEPFKRYSHKYSFKKTS